MEFDRLRRVATERPGIAGLSGAENDRERGRLKVKMNRGDDLGVITLI